MLQLNTGNYPLTVYWLIAAIIFTIFILVGFHVIFRDIKVIKQKNVTKRDRVFSFIFGFIFSTAIVLGFLIAIQYSSLALSNQPGVSLVLLPHLTSIVFFILMSIIVLYPLSEFLSLALGYRDNSSFFYQNFIHLKIVSRLKNKYLRCAVGVGFYLSIFIIIPIILDILIGKSLKISYLIIILTLAQVFPIFLLSKLGSSGYFWGINLHYYNIQEKDRLIYTFFDDRKKFMKKFRETPIPILALPIMVFVYVNSYFSLYQMIQLLLNPYAPARDPGLSFLISTIINIILALVGFYNKYWKKQIKYKLTEILFAGYLFSSLSMNIFLNFLVKQRVVLLQDLQLYFGNAISDQNFFYLIPVAMIQKIVFVIFVTYYFLGKSQLKRNILESIMMLASNRLNPKPLINLLKHENSDIKNQARKMLLEMYRLHAMKYIPPPELKKKRRLFTFTTKKKKQRQAPFQPIFEELDADDPFIRETMAQIVHIMLHEDNEKAIGLVNKNLLTHDNVKKGLILRILTGVDKDLMQDLDMDAMLSAIETGDTRSKMVGIDLLAKLHDVLEKVPDTKEKMIQIVRDCLESLDLRLQGKAMVFINDFGIDPFKKHLTFQEILLKTNHPSQVIQQGAVLLLNDFQDEFTDEKQLQSIYKILMDKNPKLQIAAVKCLMEVIDSVKIDVPIENLEKLLESNDINVLKDGLKFVARLSKINPDKYPASLIVNVLSDKDIGILGSVLKDIESIILDHPNQFMPFIMKIFENKTSLELREIAKNYLVKIGLHDFKLVLDNILDIKEDPRFSVRNFTREIIYEIGKERPDNIITLLMSLLIPDEAKPDFGTAIPFLDKHIEKKIANENFRINAAAVIGDLGKQFPEKINVEALMLGFKDEENWRVRRELAISFGKILLKIKDPPVNEYLALIDDKNNNVRNALIKGIMEIARKKPELIPINKLIEHVKDDDEFVRENIIKALGIIGHLEPANVIPFLISGLNDDKWSVRNAAAESLGNLVKIVPEQIPTEFLKEILLHDQDKWVRWQAARTIAEIAKINPNVLSIKELSGKIDLNDENLVNAFLQLIRNLNPDPIEEFIKLIKPIMNSESKTIQELLSTTLYQVHSKSKDNEPLLSELLKMVGQENPINTQRNAAIALGKIAKYGREELKKRVITVLGARCKQSRDPIICREFTAL
ncbi:MAG: HEAT repeat domain-containing protein [Promethearchaeota archaeon]